MRTVMAGLVALLVGGGIAAAINSVPSWDPFRFWGLFFGGIAVPVVFGLVSTLLNRAGDRSRKIGRWIAGVTLALFGVLVVAWIAMWGVTPFSLEGAWIYPLGLLPLVGAGILLKPRRRSAPARLWDPPPDPT